MRRSEIVKAIDQVSSAIENCNIIHFFQIAQKEIRHGGKDPDRLLRSGPLGIELIEVLKRYSIAASNFGLLEKEITGIFNLENLTETEFWASLLFNPEGSAKYFINIEKIINGAKSLILIKKLITPDLIDLHIKSKTSKSTIDKFTILIIEDNNRLSRPIRLINVLQGITSLYEAHSSILSLPDDTLLVAACDSGSDKAFDLLGIADVIKALKDTLFSLWDRILFFRQRKLLFNVRLIAEALPVISEILDCR